jgi:hypothetical protein
MKKKNQKINNEKKVEKNIGQQLRLFLREKKKKEEKINRR